MKNALDAIFYFFFLSNLKVSRKSDFAAVFFTLAAKGENFHRKYVKISYLIESLENYQLESKQLW